MLSKLDTPNFPFKKKKKKKKASKRGQRAVKKFYVHEASIWKNFVRKTDNLLIYGHIKHIWQLQDPGREPTEKGKKDGSYPVWVLIRVVAVLPILLHHSRWITAERFWSTGEIE